MNDENNPQQAPKDRPVSRDSSSPVMGDSNGIDPTPGWIPFVVVICFAVVLLFVFAIASILMP